MTAISGICPEVSATDLARLGFSGQAIEQLTALRSAYPFVEFTESGLEWQRLCFLKWRLQQERVEADGPAPRNWPHTAESVARNGVR